MATTKVDKDLIDGDYGAKTLISSTAISNAANYSFTGFDSSKYDSYEFVFHSVKPATNNVYLHCAVSMSISFIIPHS